MHSCKRTRATGRRQCAQHARGIRVVVVVGGWGIFFRAIYGREFGKGDHYYTMSEEDEGGVVRATTRDCMLLLLLTKVRESLRNDGDYLCAICHEPFRNPCRLTPCGHNYCTECVNVLVYTSIATRLTVTTCPVCREPFRGNLDVTPSDVNFRNLCEGVRQVVDDLSVLVAIDVGENKVGEITATPTANKNNDKTTATTTTSTAAGDATTNESATMSLLTTSWKRRIRGQPSQYLRIQPRRILFY